jgi:hypothetical protein
MCVLYHFGMRNLKTAFFLTNPDKKGPFLVLVCSL